MPTPITEVKFVLLSTQRSGSTWVIDMLNSHPAILAFSELLLENASGRPKWGGSKKMEFWNDYFDRANNSDSELGLIFQDYLNEVFKFSNEIKVIGFKLMYGQLGAFPDGWNYVLENRVAIIHLIRRNFLNVFISRELAHARDLYHLREDKNLDSLRIKFDTSHLKSLLDQHGQQVRRMKRLCTSENVPYLEIYHENLLQNHSNFNEILEFLSLPAPHPALHSELRKINTFSQRKVIENYTDVAKVLKNSRYETFLEQAE